MYGKLGITSNTFCSAVKFYRIRKGPLASGTWSTGDSKWDALTYQPSKKIKVFGMGVYFPSSLAENFTLCYKYVVQNSDGTALITSETFREVIPATSIVSESDDKIIKWKFTNFKNGIEIKEN